MPERSMDEAIVYFNRKIQHITIELAKTKH